MTTEDVLLPVEMGRLEIEPTRLNKTIKEENPFSSPLQKKYHVTKTTTNYKCTCIVQRRKNLAITKKKPNKLLRDPVLKLSQIYSKNSCMKTEYHVCQSLKEKKNDNLYLHTLVNNCNQLSISPESKTLNVKETEPKENAEWWKNKVVSELHPEVASERTSSSSCSQQALNPPCDVTIDELASYFETFVHIPKKMSSMAEMMYI